MTDPGAEQLPLTPLTMAVLLALSESDLHGYGLMQEIERQSAGELRPGTGSLYAALRRLVEDGLVEESSRKPDPDEDARRKYYGITARGRETARAEARRMARVLSLARERRLLDGRPSPEGT